MRLPGWRRKQQQSDLEEEIARHLDFAASERVDRGESAERAQQAARREFGNIALIEQVTRDQGPWRWLDEFLQDMRYAARMLHKNPGFTLVAVLTLALGIGANTAIFGVVNAVLLRPLPFKQPSRLMMLFEGIPKLGFPKMGFSAPDFVVFARAQKSFESVGAYQNKYLNISGDKGPERLMAAR